MNLSIDVMSQLSSFKRSLRDVKKEDTRKKIKQIKKLIMLMKFSRYVKILINLERSIEAIAIFANELVTHMKEDADV